MMRAGEIQEDDVNIPAPPGADDPQCDWCGAWGDIRVRNEAYGRSPMMLTCADCFTGPDDGPDFDDLQTAEDHAQEQADLRADHLHDQARDRRGEG